MRTYQYRVLENDDEGDPLDHGIVTAKGPSEAKVLIEERLISLELLDEDRQVRLYGATPPRTTGVWVSKGYTDFSLAAQPEDDE